MGKISLFLSVSLFVFFKASCADETQSPVLPVETMSRILADVHMAEGALLNVPYAKKDSMRVVYYNQIYGIYEISGETFKQDMEYYQRNPDKMEDIYEEVIVHLKEMDKELKKGNK